LEARDLIVTPILILLVYAAAYMVRPYVTDHNTRRYFFGAITVKIIGALAVGLIYQFYYGGGDTFNFHTHGSRHIWQLFMDSPEKGIKLLFYDGHDLTNIYTSASRIPFLNDPSSFAVIRIAAVLDLFTFSSYSATAILFSLFSFVGVWLLFITFYQRYPHLHKSLAISCLFIPSVFFWGSGLLKDTIMIGSLGMATFAIDRLLMQRKFRMSYVLFFLLSVYLIFVIKKFILQAYFPAVLLWVYFSYVSYIRSLIIKMMLLPFLLVIASVSSYYAIVKVGEGDTRYSVDRLAFTAYETAMDIRYFTGKDAGSGYSLGEVDGSFTGFINIAPKAIAVSLFRPFLWEVRNPLMALSALESFIFLVVVLLTLYRKGIHVFYSMQQADIIFCLFFSIIFAFAVGISTFNFGSLARYKIPLMPFFSIALTLMYYAPSFAKSENLRKEF
jgi:hypothetical protein